MKGKGKILICIFSFLLAIVALATSSYAWILATKRSGNIIFVTGRVKYVLTGELNEFDKIVPNKELVNKNKKFTITNDSSIDTELRMQISYQFSNDDNADDTKWILYTDECDIHNKPNYTNKVMGIISSSDTYKWKYGDYETQLWYFNKIVTDKNGKKELDPCITVDDKFEISVLESIYANGLACGNFDEASKNLFIKLEFQAKQKNFVSWSELGKIIVVA